MHDLHWGRGGGGGEAEEGKRGGKRGGRREGGRGAGRDVEK